MELFTLRFLISVTAMDRAVLLKVRCASRHRQGHSSIAYSLANGMIDHADERAAMGVELDQAAIDKMLAEGCAERAGEGLVITARGMALLEKTTRLQPAVVALARRPKPVEEASTSRWECQGCGALNPERSGACVRCKLRGTTRKEVSA